MTSRPRSTNPIVTSTSSALVAHALAKLGFPIFPCAVRAKTPLTSRGFKNASTDPEQLDAWFAKHPNANIAIATGAHVVIDVDGPLGEEALQRFGPLPVTVTVRTGKGRHLYFKAPSATEIRNSARRLGEQLDTRGMGGYVIAPPSIHPDGRRYAWEPSLSPWEVELAPLPEVLVLALTNHPVAPGPTSFEGYADSLFIPRRRLPLREWLKFVITGMREGEGRNNQAFKIALRCLEELNMKATMPILRAWNADNIHPLSDSELFQVLANASKYLRSQPPGSPGEAA